MSTFNAAGQFSPNFKTWDHQGNLMPNVEYSEGIRPHGEFHPAAWLPVVFYDKYFEDYDVVTPGKLLAFDNQGNVVPAQYGISTTNIVYTANDVSSGTIDVRTGLTVTAPATFAVSTVNTFMGLTGVALSCSSPVGVAPMAFKQWAGGDGSNPALFKQYNYNMQHQVTILCDYVLVLPWVPGAVSAESATPWTLVSANVYSYQLAQTPVATNTIRTPVSFGGTSGIGATIVNENTSGVQNPGDFNINYSTGLLTVYSAVSPTTGGTFTVSYSAYNELPSTVSVFASAVGNLVAGSFVKCDANSNFTLDSSPSVGSTMGQVLEVIQFPRDALQLVKTAYAPPLNLSAAGSLPGYSGQMDQLPGSATGGVTDSINFAGAADKLVTINLITR